MAAASTGARSVLGTTPGKRNFQRLSRLLIAGGTSVLREVFDSIYDPTALPAVLARSPVKTQLKGARLTTPQWDSLYPAPGSYGKSSDLDITLLFKLLRTICSLPSPSSGWDKLPLANDQSVCDDLARVKFYRNEVYGHVTEAMEVSDDDFIDLWAEISGALIRLARSVSAQKEQEWQQAIDKLLRDPLTPEDGRNIEELKAWYKSDSETKEMLETEFASIKGMIRKLDQHTAGVSLTININGHNAVQKHGLSLPAPSVEETMRVITLSLINAISLNSVEKFGEFVEYLERLKLAIADVSASSLHITVVCTSLEILEDLWQNYTSGELNDAAQRYLVTDEVLKKHNLKQFKLVTTIDEEEYSSCKAQLIKMRGMGANAGKHAEPGFTAQSTMFSIPAFVHPTLSLGQSFNAQQATPGISLFEDFTKGELQNICEYTFSYKVVSNNSDVKDLLDISSDLSLKIKAGLLKVEGAGKYLSDRRSKEGVTELLAVMKCTTVCEAIDDVKSVVRSDIASLPSEAIGTHYVSSVTYGGEMVASLKFKSLSGDKSNTLHGKAKGKMNIPSLTGGLKVQLDKVARECTKESDIEIKYYGTVQPEKLPTNFEDFVHLIENFPKRMRETDDGQGVPVKFELQPVQNLNIKQEVLYMKKTAIEAHLRDFENRYDDLRCCYKKMKKYFSEVDDAAKEMLELNKSVKTVLKVFLKAIQELNLAGDENQLEASEEAYNEALGGIPRDGKFMAEWRKIVKNMAPVKHTFKAGRDLTVVLFGKTGNGKSSTGNQIVGEECFKVGYSAMSETAHCGYHMRTGDRGIRVIDTPSVMHTSLIAELKNSRSFREGFTKQVKRTLNEAAKVFEMAPFGFDAILLVAQYGSKFTLEDNEALKVLVEFLGEESKANMILVLTHADQAALHAQREGVSVEKLSEKWLNSLPDWVQEFIRQINNRVVMFNNTLETATRSEAQVKQVAQLVDAIDVMTEGRKPFIHELTNASKKKLDERVEKAMKASDLIKELSEREEKKKALIKAEAEKMAIEAAAPEFRSTLLDDAPPSRWWRCAIL